MSNSFAEKLIGQPRYVGEAEPHLLQPLGECISTTFKTLLETKHLYQSIELDLSALEAAASQLPLTRHIAVASATTRIVHGSHRSANSADHVHTGKVLISRAIWSPNITAARGLDSLVASIGAKNQGAAGPKTINFTLPTTIHAYCAHCKKVWPFNPALELGKVEQSSRVVSDQWFFLSYICQSCKLEPVRYLIRRIGTKIRLCGRDPIGEVTPHQDLPKAIREHFGSAEIACNAGQTLAGIFFLRVFVEQFYRSIPAAAAKLKKQPRLSGEELGAIYHETLPADFKQRFPSLPSIYGELSEAIHLADSNLELYRTKAAQIIEHFEARRIYKLPA